MKLIINPRRLELSGRLGPSCIACGNTRTFFIHTPNGDVLCDLRELPEGDVRIMACGRCRSRHSIVIAHVD